MGSSATVGLSAALLEMLKCCLRSHEEAVVAGPEAGAPPMKAKGFHLPEVVKSSHPPHGAAGPAAEWTGQAVTSHGEC